MCRNVSDCPVARTAKPYDPLDLKIRVKIAGTRRTLGYFIERKFGLAENDEGPSMEGRSHAFDTHIADRDHRFLGGSGSTTSLQVWAERQLCSLPARPGGVTSTARKLNAGLVHLILSSMTPLWPHRRVTARVVVHALALSGLQSTHPSRRREFDVEYRPRHAPVI